MKYYIGRVQVRDDMNQYDADACIAAKNEAQAQHLLETRAQMYGGDDGEPTSDGWYGFNSDTVMVRADGLTEVSPVTFSEMSRLLPVFGESGTGDLAEESSDQRVRTLARRIGDQLVKRDAKVAHGKLLHAVAASLGETDWQVLLHKQDAEPVAEVSTPEEGLDGYDNLNSEIPGSGLLWRVPVSVDTSMTALVLARGMSKDEAMEAARRFASEGKARFSVDDGNYRGYADHYVSDDSDDGVYPVPEPDSVPLQAHELEAGGAVLGGYVVELTELTEDDDELLWGDLRIYGAPDGEAHLRSELDTESCLTACPRSATFEEQQAFCKRVVELLYSGAPDPTKVKADGLRGVFVNAVQGDQTPEAFAALRRRLQAPENKA